MLKTQVQFSPAPVGSSRASVLSNGSKCGEIDVLPPNLRQVDSSTSLGKKEKKTRVPKPPKERKPPWRKVKLPLLEEIQSLAEKMSFDNVGKIYGVSGNAVRKWFVGYTGTVPKFKRA